VDGLTESRGSCKVSELCINQVAAGGFLHVVLLGAKHTWLDVPVFRRNPVLLFEQFWAVMYRPAGA